MMKKIAGLFIEEKGQGMTEYGLILGLIALAVVGGLTLFGQGLDEKFDEVVAKLKGTTTTPTTP
jgi:pilus assembly protein Flp/PilA